MPDTTCVKCGIFLDFGICPSCGREYKNLTAEESLSVEAAMIQYAIPEDLVKKVESIDFLNDLTDNCIVYVDSRVDAYSNPEDLLNCLCDEECLIASHKDIAFVIVEGHTANFSLYDRVNLCLSEPQIPSVRDFLNKEVESMFEFIVIMDDKAHKTFLSSESLCKFIEELSENKQSYRIFAIFIHGEQHEFEIEHCFKLDDCEMMIEEPLAF